MNRRRFPTEQELEKRLEEAEVQAEILRDIRKNAPEWERLDRELAGDPEYRAAPPAVRSHPMRRIAVLIAALLALSCVPAVAVNWEEIYGFLVQQWSTHTSVSNLTLHTQENEPAKWEGLYMPAWLPEGFYPETQSDHRSYLEVFFENDKGVHLVLAQGNENFSVELDTEYANAEPVQVNGSPGVIAERDGIVRLAWGSRPQFLLSGPLSHEDMIRIAESVSPPTEINEKEGRFP